MLKAEHGISSQAGWNTVLPSYLAVSMLGEQNLGQPFNLIVNFAFMPVQHNVGA